MRLTYLILALVLNISVHAQTLGDLDKKGGFKEFKIGDDIAVHKDKAKFTKTLENADTKLYLVKELVSVKTYTGEVELKFYKDKLAEVIVSFKNSSKDDFEDLQGSLETLYGKPQNNKDKSPKLERFEKILVWNGEKIGLRLGFDPKYKLTQMVYFERNNLDKLKEEF